MFDFLKGPYYTEFIATICATCVTDVLIYPFTTARIRLQMMEPTKQPLNLSTRKTLAQIAMKEGYRHLYSGLKVSFLRLIVYHSLRMGLLYSFEDILKTKTQFEQEVLKQSTNLFALVCIQPLIVAKVRYQAGTYAPQFPMHQAFISIHKGEGFLALFRGLVPNSFRSMVSYGCDTHARHYIDTMVDREILLTHTIEKFIATNALYSLVTVLLTNPIDVTRNRYINDHSREYKNVLHCILRIFQLEGPGAFYRGATAYYYSSIISNLILLSIYDHSKSLLQLLSNFDSEDDK